MNRLIVSTLALAFAASAAAAIPRSPAPTGEPVFEPGNHYGAVLDQSDASWRLLPLDGQDVLVSARADACAGSARLPRGVWLLVRDGEGRPELLAPSTTLLPPGHPERVRLRACDEAPDGAPSVVAPRVLIEWLATRTGAVFVDG